MRCLSCFHKFPHSKRYDTPLTFAAFHVFIGKLEHVSLRIVSNDFGQDPVGGSWDHLDRGQVVGLGCSWNLEISRIL